MSDTIPTQTSRTKTIILVVVAVVLLVATSVGVYGLWFAPKPGQTPPSPSMTTSATSKPTAAPSRPGVDPEGFARLVAATLFDWDTMADTRQQITTKLVAWGDPDGEETAGLVSDIAMYLPDPTTWATLQGYETRQRLDIATVAVPASWPSVVASAGPDQILPGTVAYTISGTRHRDGVVGGKPDSIDRPVAFTMLITCAPAYPTCHLMRLGQPDQPMH